jgi:glycosyltransferase involved in cell wall biosynthesis
MRSKKFYNIKKCESKISPNIKLLFVGKVRHIKGVIYLIRAANILSKRYPLELRIVGDGSERPLFEAYCRKQNLKFVRFIGDIPNKIIANEYLNCDIFCLPSLH